MRSYGEMLENGREKDFDAGEYGKRYFRMDMGAFPTLFPEDTSPEVRETLFATFYNVLQTFAPHQLKEYAQLEKAFAMEAGSWAKRQCFNSITNYFNGSIPGIEHECTSWNVAGALTCTGQNFHHKNRDSKAKTLALLHRAVPGKYAFTALTDRGSFHVNSGINEKGLALSMNSGDETEEYNHTGLTTPHLARILIEECATADEAVAKLQELLAFHGYLHGKKGSIWHFTDPCKAIVVEHNSRHFAAHEVTHGIGLRANCWEYPEMIPYSTKTLESRLDSVTRAQSVRRIVMDEGWQEHRVIKLQDMFRAARCRAFHNTGRAPCSKTTNSATTFLPDKEFPGILSTAWIAPGPPRHTVFLPIPMAIEVLPEELLNGSFCDRIFARAEKTGLDVSTSSLTILEEELIADQLEVTEKARLLLREGKEDAAGTLLAETFQKNWEKIKSHAISVTGTPER